MPARRITIGAGLAAALAVAALLCGLFVWELRGAGPATVDDAYITFSFSKNLATGHGPVYGHGVRVEGYSNFLWMVVVAIGLGVGRIFRLVLDGPGSADPLMVARAATVPFVALLAFSTYRACRLQASRAGSLLVLALLAINLDLVSAFLIGLETVPYAALLAGAFLLYLQSWERPSLRRWVVPAFVAVALCRIDGFVPLGFVLVFEAARRLLLRRPASGGAAADQWPEIARDYLRWAAPALLVYLGWFGWRWAYYGLPLPSTYYAKALIPKLMPARGWEYVRDETAASGVFLALPFALWLLARRNARALCLIAFVLLQLVYAVKAGGDWMPFGRFLLPVFPLILIVIVWGGEDLARACRRRLGRLSLVLLALPAAALLWVGRSTERHLTREPRQLRKLAEVVTGSAQNDDLKVAARLLSHAIPPGARLVTDYGGIFAYYTDAAPIEMWGLCNALIATKGGTERINPIFGRTCPECYPALDPQFFHVWAPIARDLQAFHSHLEVVGQVWQTDTIGRYIDFARDFVSGRAMNPSRNRAVYFLERRRPGVAYRARRAGDTVVIDYPFEPGGRAAGL